MAAHRYWRIYILESAVGWTRICELELRASKGGSDETGSGTAADSSHFSSYVAAEAFDNDLSAAHSWVANNSGTINLNEWVSYDFGSGVTKDIVEIAITPWSGEYSRTPSKFALQYSDDNSTWYTLYEWVYTWANNNQQIFNDTNAMSSVQKVYSLTTGVEYDVAGKQKVSSLTANVEYDPPGKIKISSLTANVEYYIPNQKVSQVYVQVENEKPPKQKVSQIYVQVESEAIEVEVGEGGLWFGNG